MNFRILFWAAKINKPGIVKFLLNEGYSPFLRVYDKKNTLMNAIEGGNTEIVKLILSYNFQSDLTDIKLKKVKMKTDSLGNTPLHLAFKKFNKDIGEELTKNPDFDFLGTRNQRGLLPKEMNHKKIQLDFMQNDNIPDYLMLVEKNRAEFLRV